MPELGYQPVNKYLPPRRDARRRGAGAPAALERRGRTAPRLPPLLRWLDRALSCADCMHPAFSVIALHHAWPARATACWRCSACTWRSARRRSADRLRWRHRCSALRADHRGPVRVAAHLGQPERAWRALSQWRSSWLSREGVAALATLRAASRLIALLWLDARGAAPARGGRLPAVLGRALTLYCTARDLRLAQDRSGPGATARCADLFRAVALWSGAIVLLGDPGALAGDAARGCRSCWPRCSR